MNLHGRVFAFHSVILVAFMLPSREKQDRILLFVAIAAAGLIQISIAASQIFLGLGILLVLIFRQKLQFPRIWIPLACFFVWTALADVVSPDPWLGRAQIKKFFVFFFIPLVYGVFAEQFNKSFYLIVAWTAAGAASGLWALIQFAQSARGSYVLYVQRRITGFESHWMTFGALQLTVLLILLAQWFFSSRRLPSWAYASVAVLGAAILLGGTRSIWLAGLPSVLYLLWVWRPKMIFLVPVTAALAFAMAPLNVRTRVLSLVHPQENVDSNRHRMVTFRTGLAMIKAHPWLGLGPEEIRRNFDNYVPKDVARPLPAGYYGHLHNIYIQYAAERGIPGMVFILWLIGETVWDAFRAIRRLGSVARSQELFVLHGTIAVTIAILVGGIFEYNLGDSEVLMMYVSVIALGYAAARNVVPYAGLSPRAQMVSKYGGSDSR